jgi:serine protease Do
MDRKKIFTFLLILFFFIFVMIFLKLQPGVVNKEEKTPALDRFPQSFADIAEKVKPAVVNISTISIVKLPGNPFDDFFSSEDDSFGEFYNKFFNNIPDREMKQRSLGSGFIIDKEGYIVTNNHVVEGTVEIKVKLSDGNEYPAKVVGRDPKTDLALIKISTFLRDLPVVPVGDSDKMRVGDLVLAIGNPFGLEQTVTQGIISATGRVIGSGPYDDFLQTDAPINPGNSGGPLLNLKGEVIGINAAIVGNGQGIGFAIPINMAKGLISQLKEKGKVIRGWIGVSIQNVTPEMAQSFGLKEAKGALVSDVVPAGPAEVAGVERGDIIIGFDGREVKKMSDLPRLVAETTVGKVADMKIVRATKEMVLKVTIAELTDEILLSSQQLAGKFLGMAVDDLTPRWKKKFNIHEKTGVVVIGVVPGSASNDVGIQAGDVIKEMDRKPIWNMKDYKEAVKSVKGAEPLLLLISRGGHKIFISVKNL